MGNRGLQRDIRADIFTGQSAGLRGVCVLNGVRVYNRARALE